MSFVITNTQLPTFTTPQPSRVVIPVEVLPEAVVSNYQEIVPKLTIDGDEVVPRRAAWNAPKSGTGIDCSFILADIADRGLIDEDSVIKFEVGVVVAGVTTWYTIIDLAHLSQTNFQIAGDTFSFNTISGVTDRLNLTASNPFVMYDPARSPFDVSALKPIRNTNGFAYSTTAMAVAGMTLYDIFDEIFTERCGFAGWESNIEDFPVRQVEWDFTTKYIDPIKPLLGEYEALLFEHGGKLHIRDLTQALPAGYPEPPELTIFGVTEVNVTAPFTDIDGAIMVISVPDTFDYRTSRNEFDSFSVTPPGMADVVTTMVRSTIAEFRNRNAPDVILKEETLQEITDIVKNNVWIFKETIDNNFDRYGRILQARHTVSEYVEDLSQPQGRVLENSEATDTLWTYAQHPFRANRQYQLMMEHHESGLIMVDSANQHRGADFRQSMKVADFSGNLEQGQTTEFGLISSYYERGTPLPNGQVRQISSTINQVRDKVQSRRTAARPGDISMNGGYSEPIRIIVYDDDLSERGSRSLQRRNDVLFTVRPELVEKSAGRMIEFHLGQMTFEQGKALARRKIRRLRTGNKEATVELAVFDPTIHRGSERTIKDKQNNLEGAFIVEGYSGVIEVNDDGGNTWSMTADVSQI